MPHHTLKEVIQNQKMFKDKITYSFFSNIKSAKIELMEIKSEDEFILKEKIKLEKRFKKTKIKTYFDRLFFLNPKRNLEFYIWWDENKEEFLILKYE